MRLLGLVVVMACASTATAPRAKIVRTNLQVPASAPRLPRDFVPTGYRVRLAIGDDLTGHIEIAGSVSRATSLIWLDSDGLEIRAAHAEQAGSSVKLVAQRTRWDAGSPEKLALQSVHPLAPGSWTLVIDYRGPIPDQALDADRRDPNAVASATEHVFRERPQGEPYVFTNFEPFGARRAFPCFDEPDIKVPWQLAFDVPSDVMVAGNTAISHDVALSPSRKLVELAPTRPLPSYLIAFAIGKLDVAGSGRSASGVPVRVLVPHAWTWAAVPVDTVTRSLDLLEAWTGIPYPYDKLDLVAVPMTGKSWTAMENAGLVMYGAPSAVNGDAAFTVAHELAHHWFGNLVTLKWWDDIWLNESFAAFMTSKLVPQLDPKADPKEDVRNRQRLFDDAAIRHAVLPVRPEMTAATDSDALLPFFNGNHGAMLLRTIERFTGEDAFRDAIRAYLAAHVDGTATTRDLTAALDHATGISWEPVIDPFLDQTGLPTLTFKLDCSGARPTLSLFTTPLEHWTVPACVAYDADGARSEQCVMVTGGRTLALDSQHCPTWVEPDPGAVGLYRTQLANDQVVALVEHGWPALTPVERSTVFSIVPNATSLPLVTNLLAAGDDEALIAAARLVRMAALDLPDHAIAASRRPWIDQHFVRFARNLHFHIASDGPWNGELFILGLVAATRDPALEVEASRLVKDSADLDLATEDIVLGLALAADPALLRSKLDGAATADDHQRAVLANALERVPGTLAAFEENPKRAAQFSFKQLSAILAATCDPSTRDRAAAIASAQFSAEASATAIAGLDACIVSRKQVDDRLKRELGI
jgi:peptidase M1-like protein